MTSFQALYIKLTNTTYYAFCVYILGNPLLCDCELRWYHQWIEEEWNPVEQEWLKDTFCEDPADKKQHNIAEVPLKDMFCTTDVKDKPSASRVSKKCHGNAKLYQIFLLVPTPTTLQHGKDMDASWQLKT